MDLKNYLDSISLKDEKWKTIDETNGRYLVSSKGRVLSTSYRVSRRVNGIFNPKLLLPSRTRSGLCTVELFGKPYYLHYLVALYHVSNPLSLPRVVHISNNKEDNSSENLMWAESYSKRVSDKSIPCYNQSLQDISGEFWAEISGTQGGYWVSNFGRVKSLKRKAAITTQKINQDGYPQTYVVINGKGCYVNVHKLVALAFIERKQSSEEVDHVDGNKLNNHVSNLRWVSHVDNMRNPVTKERFKKRKGPFLGKVGKNHPCSKPIYAINEKGERIDFEGSWDADRKGFKYHSVQHCLHHPGKSYRGYRWFFK